MEGGVLCLPRSCEAAIRRHGEEAYPDEACGILIGRTVSRGVAVVEVRRARNLNTDRARDRYDLDPLDQLRAEEEAGLAGLAVVGFYHTHPDHPASASRTDANLAWPGYHYVICALAQGKPGDLRAWTFRDRGAEPRESRVEAEEGRSWRSRCASRPPYGG